MQPALVTGGGFLFAKTTVIAETTSCKQFKIAYVIVRVLFQHQPVFPYKVVDAFNPIYEHLRTRLVAAPQVRLMNNFG